jgi:hypothetical protein
MPDDGDALTLHDVRSEHAETHRLLALVLAELGEMRLLVEHRERTPTAPRLHIRTAGPLLQEISAGVGSASWCAAELIAESERDRPLRRAIVTATGPLDAGSTRRLGRLLGQVEDVPVGGHVVERIETNGRDGARWRVLRV